MNASIQAKEEQTPIQTPIQATPMRRRRNDSIPGRPGAGCGAARLLKSALFVASPHSRTSVVRPKVPGPPSSWTASLGTTSAQEKATAQDPCQCAGFRSSSGDGKKIPPRPSVLGRKSRASRLSIAERQLLQSLIGDASDSELWYSGEDADSDENVFASLSGSEISSPRSLNDQLRTSTSPRRCSLSPSKAGRRCSMSPSKSGRRVPCSYMMGGDSDEDSVSSRSSRRSSSSYGGSLEDMFSFDPSLVAQALHEGAGFEKLTGVIENALADALDKRVRQVDLLGPSISPGDDIEGRMTPPARELLVDNNNQPVAADDLAGRMTPTCLEQDDLAGRMTPPRQDQDDLIDRITPQEPQKNGNESTAVISEQAADDLEDKLAAVMACAVARRRRSSAARLNEQQRRRRKSFSVASTVVEASGDVASDASWESKVELIQKAMEEARKRHNKNIAKAVKEVACVQAGAPLAENNIIEGNVNLQDKIQQAVSAAYLRQQEASQWDDYTAAPDTSFHQWGGSQLHASDVSVGAAWSPPDSNNAGYSPSCYSQHMIYQSPQSDYMQSPDVCTRQDEQHQQQAFFTPYLQQGEQQLSPHCFSSPQQDYWGEECGQPVSVTSAFAHYGSA